ncbi:4Fe-4S binding protein [bacterium]|nr:4Fe-4S binding protein [bacterium]
MKLAARSPQNFWLKTIVLIILLGTAWVIGIKQQARDMEPAYRSIFSGADSFKSDGNIISAMRDNRLIGYLATGEAIGYGGTMQMLVATDTTGTILKIDAARHTETPAFYYRVSRNRIYRRLKDKAITDEWIPGKDIDIVSGATYTSKAFIDGSRIACGKIAHKIYGQPISRSPGPPWKFGRAEILLIGLFGLGLLARGPLKKQAKIIRWISMLTGLVTIGFIINQPLTIGWINRMLLGQFPPIPNHLYWYILIGGIVTYTLTTGFNPYCNWFCPFGAAQECLGKVGGGKKKLPIKLHRSLKLILSIAALCVVLTALVTRNPTMPSYEVFGVMFRMIGDTWQFIVMALVLIASLFIRRPWCSYLCPLHPLFNALKAIRRTFSS